MMTIKVYDPSAIALGMALAWESTPVLGAEMLDIPAHEPEFYSIKQAAQRLGVSRWFIYDEIRAGRLVAHKVGRAVRIHKDDLGRYLAANVIEPVEPLVVCT